LINNAGFGMFTDTGDWKKRRNDSAEYYNINPIHKLFFKTWFFKKKGQNKDVASTAAFQPGPWHVVLCNKGLYAFLKRLYNEVRDNGITVTAFMSALKAGFRMPLT
jgi:short-subunit dehydrogenase